MRGEKAERRGGAERERKRERGKWELTPILSDRSELRMKEKAMGSKGGLASW